VNVKRAVCTSCGAPVQILPGVEHLTCTYCGTQLVVEREEDNLGLKAVEEVGNTASSGAQRRARAGMDAASAAGYRPKDWMTAMVLCVLLGWLGAHRFYSGHTLIGFVQLFTGGGFFLWWLIDLGLIVSGQYRDSKGVLLGNRNPAMGSGCAWALVVLIVISFFGGLVATATDGESFPTVVMVLALAVGTVVFVFRYLRARKEG